MAEKSETQSYVSSGFYTLPTNRLGMIHLFLVLPSGFSGSFSSHLPSRSVQLFGVFGIEMDHITLWCPGSETL